MRVPKHHRAVPEKDLRKKRYAPIPTEGDIEGHHEGSVEGERQNGPVPDCLECRIVEDDMGRSLRSLLSILWEEVSSEVHNLKGIRSLSLGEAVSGQWTTLDNHSILRLSFFIPKRTQKVSVSSGWAFRRDGDHARMFGSAGARERVRRGGCSPRFPHSLVGSLSGVSTVLNDRWSLETGQTTTLLYAQRKRNSAKYSDERVCVWKRENESCFGRWSNQRKKGGSKCVFV